MQHDIEFSLREVLFSYYLKEHDKEKGCFQLILRREKSQLVTCLRSNDHGWKDKYFFTKGELIYVPDGAGDAASHWKTK